jgi:nucleoside triphosphate diphosphatase
MIEAQRGLQLLLDIMARLRDPQRGCPWDVAQDFRSIAPYTLEEAYEVADAIERGQLDELRAELGDLLLQVVFHAQMAKEQAQFDFADVVQAINRKMLRRHPHVDFSDLHPLIAENKLPLPPSAIARGDAAQQTARWREIKAQERAERGDSAAPESTLDSVSRGLNAWQRALQLQGKAAEQGFDWPSITPVLAKLREEVAELAAETEVAPIDPERALDELGDVLFVAVNIARHLRLDPEAALRRCNQKFERRYRGMEALAKARGLDLSALDLAAQDAIWDAMKAQEKAAGRS